MTEAALNETALRKFNSFVEARLGLCFPPQRWGDLERGLRMVSAEFGFDDPLECARWIGSTTLTRQQMELIAAHLTIGETYFFRDPKAFEALERKIVPDLIAARATGSRMLRFWSAGCCTGEEAYTIAIILDRLLPEGRAWHVSILGTDVNPRFLQKAKAGTYTEWSFRVMDELTKRRYFEEMEPGRFRVIPRIKEMVDFAPLNLIDDVYPSLTTNTNGMDVIFCRNVLMYFSGEQARKVVCKLSDCLLPGSHLFTSAAEASSELFDPLKPQSFPGTVIYRKESSRSCHNYSPEPVVNTRSESKKAPAVSVPATSAFQASRSLANEARLTEALNVCDEEIRREKLRPETHYLRGIILQEQGAIDEAIGALRRALFLDQGFVLAHFAMGNLMLRRSRRAEAERYFGRTRDLLRRYDADAVLPESDGLTAGRLLAMLETMQEARS